MTRNRRGFSFLELITVVAVLGILVGISIPQYQQVRRRADAAKVVGAVHVVRHAAYSYNESTQQWPPAAAFGSTPPGLASYLPSGFSLTQPTFSLAWMSLDVVQDGLTQTTHTIGISVPDGLTCQEVESMLGGSSNADVTALCWAGGGQVQVKVDR